MATSGPPPRNTEELQSLVLEAFRRSRRTGKADWYRMAPAVLKNRLLDVTARRFDEREYGAERFSDLLHLLSPTVSLDTSARLPVVELLPEARALLERDEQRASASGRGRICQDAGHALVGYSSAAESRRDLGEEIMETTITAAHEALETLTQARVAALGVSSESVDRVCRIQLSQLGDALKAARSPRQRLVVGAIWAQRLAEGARTPRQLDSGLFRFAQHLRESSTNAETPGIWRSVLDVAAREAFARLRSTLAAYRIRVTEAERQDVAVTWSAVLGMDQADWLGSLDVVGRGSRRPDVAPARKAPPEIHYPGWLALPAASGASKRLLGLATWRAAAVPDDIDVAAAARAAYVAFLDRDFEAAREELRVVEDSLGSTWAPSEAADARAFFAWVRAIPLVNVVYSPEGSATSHHLLSALELLRRVDDPAFDGIETDLLDRFLVTPTGDHVADLDWASLRYRLCRLLGHEAALGDLDNPTKASLRSLWKQGHAGLPFADDSTVGMVRYLDDALGQAMTPLQTAAAEPNSSSERWLSLIRPFCDSDEKETLEQVLAAVRAYLTRQDAVGSMQRLRELANVIEDASDAVRESGSLLLQEALLPLLAQVASAISEAIEKLSAAGGPDLAAELLTDRLPLLHGAGTLAHVRIQIRNQGTMVARNVRMQAQSERVLAFPTAPAVVGDVPAGAVRDVELEAEITVPADSVSFDALIAWDDDFDREALRHTSFFAEAEREPCWSDTDRNPFQLSSIEDPDRLIGRDEYIQQFRDIARSGGSMYVTGLKRVGKTSLVRVALTLLEREGALAVYLPLGRALGQEPSAADLVRHMLTKLEDAATDAFGEDSIPRLDSAKGANFSQVADRWLRRLRRALPPESMAVIALDDFDALPAALRSGDEGDALFLFLRTLVDESWISVTFIGSEVLPTLLSQQSQHLNQVDPIQVHNFGSRDSTGDLLGRPSASRFDWTDEAIDAVHSLTEGNPYYATILGSRVWTALRERSRTLAHASDVTKALEGLAGTETQSHFMHLWADDPEGLDAASPRAIRASAVLRAVARCSTTPGALVDRDEVVSVAQQWVPGSTSELLHEAYSTLIRRGVLHEADSGQLRLRIPLVGAWLQRAGGRHLDEIYRDSPLARRAEQVVTASDYRLLSRHLSYQSNPISTTDLQAWVEQLPDKTHQYLAFQLLRRACTDGYFSQHRVQTEVVPALTERLREGPLKGRERRAPNQWLTGVIVLDHGASGSSAPALLRQMLASLRITKAAVAREEDAAARIAVERPVLVLVLDEFAGSGRQLSGAVRRLVEALDVQSPGWRDETTIAVGIGVTPGHDAAAAFSDLPCEVAVGVMLGPEVRAFHEDAKLFSSDADRLAAKDLMAAIGRSLKARPPLGFQDQGLLVVFESNCPNNTLPALWRAGDYGGRHWLPLFERIESIDRSGGSKSAAR